MEQTEPIIRLENLEKTYHSRRGNVTALKGISLCVARGDIFGIIGLSGAGKSTLVRCINFLERPTAGRVIVRGQDLGALSKAGLLEARRHMGMIFQQFNLLQQRTALQNICFPLEIAGAARDKARQRAQELLEIVGLSDRADAYPAQLSGGQQQRVAIARALATEPEVLLCDEATSALDPTTTRSILALLREINRSLGVTVVVITHEMRVIEEICTRVAIIDRSQIAETGPVEQVFLSPQSQIGRQLVFPEGQAAAELSGERCVRVVFDGNSSFEPVIAGMVLTCKTMVNILFADTRDVGGKAYGQMILQLPSDDAASRRVTAYLRAQHVHVEEGTVNAWREGRLAGGTENTGGEKE